MERRECLGKQPIWVLKGLGVRVLEGSFQRSIRVL